jgi:hypothetical protein
MSTRQRGNIRENEIADMLRAKGYCVFPSRGSRGVDLFCVSFDPSGLVPDPVNTPRFIAIEVGGRSKTISASFDKLIEADVPFNTGFLVARQIKDNNRNLWRYHYTNRDGHFHTDDLLHAVRGAWNGKKKETRAAQKSSSSYSSKNMDGIPQGCGDREAGAKPGASDQPGFIPAPQRGY